jgi:hypothetical protein
LNFSLTDLYRKDRLGANNGIDIDSTRSLGLDPFNEAEAIPFLKSASESSTRRDVALSALALAFDDSLSPSQANLYFTTAERQYNDPTGLSSGAFDSYAFEVHGFSFRQTLQAGLVRLVGGVQLERRITGLGPLGVRRQSVSAGYALAAARFGIFRPEAMVRGERNGDGQGLSWGVHMNLQPSENIVIGAGWSDSRRFPTLQELNWPLYSFSGPPDLLEKHRVALISLRLHADPLRFSIGATQRTVDDAVVFKILSPPADFPALVVQGGQLMNVKQVSGSLEVSAGGFEADLDRSQGGQRNHFHPAAFCPDRRDFLPREVL